MLGNDAIEPPPEGGGLLTGLKFTENGIMLDHPEEELFIPYGSLKLVRGHKGKSNNGDIKLQEYR